MSDLVFPDDEQEVTELQKYETYQRNKELHFLQMRNNMRNSFMNHNKKKKSDSLAHRSKSGLLGLQATGDESNPVLKSKALHYSRSRDNISGLQAKQNAQLMSKPQDLSDAAKNTAFQTSGRFGDLKMTFNDHLQMEESSAGER